MSLQLFLHRLIINVSVIALSFSIKKVKDQWVYAYQADLDTKALIYRLSINVLLDNTTILKLSTAYRNDISRNIVGLLKGRLVNHEPTLTVTKYICRIIVQTSFIQTQYLIYCMQYLLMDTWLEYKILYRIRF